jgi:hypothetical protein
MKIMTEDARHSDSPSLRLLDIETFDLASFKDRWAAARRAAILPILGPDAYSSMGDTFSIEVEQRWLALVPPERQDDILKAVFEKGWKLGRSAARHFGVLWCVSDMAELIAKLDIPCYGRDWQREGEALVLKRSGCPGQSGIGSFLCRYWREAFDGLVMGTGDTARFARHGSIGHGDEFCIDILYDEKNYAMSDRPRSGPIPAAIKESLEPVVERMAKLNVDLFLEGYGDGILYYHISPRKGTFCGASGKIFNQMARKNISARMPSILLLDTAPISVYRDE